MKHIEELLSSLKELRPIETDLAPKYNRDTDIKAVVFDIYGTLLVSSSGDIDQAVISENHLKVALDASNISIIDKRNNALEHILHDFEYTIKICHNEARKNNVPYPEIDILSIWEIVLLHARRKKLIQFNGDANIMLMTCIFEFLSNKVYPMPAMQQTILELYKREYPLGIVSNAQFYTPVVMNYFLNKTVGLNEDILHFDPELTVYSYRLGIGKPDTGLFRDLVPILKSKYKISARASAFYRERHA
jgi:putative hydrolase of the HAD superfamily